MHKNQLTWIQIPGQNSKLTVNSKPNWQPWWFLEVRPPSNFNSPWSLRTTDTFKQQDGVSLGTSGSLLVQGFIQLPATTRVAPSSHGPGGACCRRLRVNFRPTCHRLLALSQFVRDLYKTHANRWPGGVFLRLQSPFELSSLYFCVPTEPARCTTWCLHNHSPGGFQGI